LANYKYFNMDQAFKNALDLFHELQTTETKPVVLSSLNTTEVGPLMKDPTPSPITPRKTVGPDPVLRKAHEKRDISRRKFVSTTPNALS
jgi:hypothetical protein